MSIKVTLGEVKTQEPKPFPKLMATKSGLIVLFESKGKGQVIFDKDKVENRIGEISRWWDMDSFTDYTEPITIQNV